MQSASPEARRVQGTMDRVANLAASQSMRGPGASAEDALGHGEAFFDNGGRREAAVSISGRSRRAPPRAIVLLAARPAADRALPRGSAASEAQGAAVEQVPAWEQGSFEGSKGAKIAYKYRMPAGAEGKVPTIFVGGLALAESFEPYFKRHAPEAGQFTLWLRGLPPSQWTTLDGVFDADAFDLARMIVLAGRKSGSQRVDLALHSYSTMLFQRLLGLREDPLVAEALRYLKGAKVTLFMGSTHYEGVENDMDPMSYLKLKLSTLFVDMISLNDTARDFWRDLAGINPLLFPISFSYGSVWTVFRSLLLSSAGQDVGRDLKNHLREPWAPDIEPVRQELLKLIDQNAGRPDWQEAALRRFVDLLHLDFSPADVQEMRRMGIRLNTVAAVRDDILPWSLQRHLLMRLGIEAPMRTPKAGTVLTDKEGRFRLTVVDSDHFYPLREPDGVRDILEGKPVR